MDCFYETLHLIDLLPWVQGRNSHLAFQENAIGDDPFFCQVACMIWYFVHKIIIIQLLMGASRGKKWAIVGDSKWSECQSQFLVSVLPCMGSSKENPSSAVKENLYHLTVYNNDTDKVQ